MVTNTAQRCGVLLENDMGNEISLDDRRITPQDKAAIEDMVNECGLVEIEVPHQGQPVSIVRFPSNFFKTAEKPYAIVYSTTTEESDLTVETLLSAVKTKGLVLNGIGEVVNNQAMFRLYRCISPRNRSQEYSDSVNFMGYLENKERPFRSIEISGGFLGGFRSLC